MFRCFTNRNGTAVLGAVIAGAIYLVFWHGSHLATVAPLLIVFACPIMHLFGLGGHHGGHHGAEPKSTTADNPQSKED